jgi:DNA-directed RNA polymerase specialized sigma24 family protein
MQLRNKYIFTELNDTHLEEAEEKLDFNILQAKEQSYDKLEKAIIQLKTEQKTCISLFYLQNKSYLQIAQSTGFSILQVKSFIQNGKRNLKLIMQIKEPKQ